MKAALKMLKSFISPDQLNAIANELIKDALAYKNNIVLNPETGEVEAAAFIYEVEKNVFVSVVTLNNENKIIRFDTVKPLNELIDELLKKI